MKMMKRLLSIFTASAVAVSAAAAMQLSAAAFTLNSTYDEVKINNSFNTESNTGAPDGTAYKISDGTDTIWNTSSGIVVNNTNYYFSVDFKVGSAAGTLIKMTNSGGDVGPQLSLDGTTLRNQTGNNKHENLYTSFDVNKWYKIEFEGRMKAGSATNYTLYEYNNSTATQVATGNIYLRNFDNSKNYAYTTLASGVSYDNEYAVQEWPDAVQVSQENSITELTAGQSAQFTAAALRAGTSDNITQPAFTWTVTGVKEGEEGYFSVDGGKLIVSSQASEQTINIVATASSNNNPAGTYAVKINAFDASVEKFDTIAVSGDASINAGGTAQYSFSASKGATDVTSSLTSDDVVWSVVDSTGSRVLGNKYITISNSGLLTVGSSVIGQNICVRASTPDGMVYCDHPVAVNGVYTETVYNANACEEAFADGDAELIQGSWDGSSYYKYGKNNKFLGAGSLSGSTSGDILISVDVKFEADGAGFITHQNMSKEEPGLWLVRNGGVLAAQTGGSSYSKLNNGSTYALDTDSWYHIELMFYTENSELNIWKYDENGNKTNKATYTKSDGLTQRNSGRGFNHIRVNSNTGIDNYMVIDPQPDAVSVSTDEELDAGSSASVKVSISRDGLNMKNVLNKVKLSVYDSANRYPSDSEDVTITATTVSASALAVPKTVYIRATSVYDAEKYDAAALRIVGGKQFEITNIGVDSVNENEVVMIYANKLTDYKDDVVFLMTFFDENGRLVGAYSKKANAKNLSVGENEIVIDYTLPEGYNKETGTAKLMAWTSLTSNEEPEGISGSFRASYSDGVITLSNAPSVSGTTTIAIFDSGNNVVYQAQSDSAVASLNTGALASGGYTVTLGGAVVDGSYVTYKAIFTVD